MENSTVLVETLNIKILPTIFLRISKLRKERNKQAIGWVMPSSSLVKLYSDFIGGQYTGI